MGFLSKKSEEVKTEEQTVQAEVKKEDKPRYEVVEVTATTQLAIRDNETKETMDLLQAIVELRNDVNEIYKFLSA